MMLGMGTVFVFLSLLVFATFGLSKLVAALGLAGHDSVALRPASISEIEGVAAAAAAVHRARRG